MNREILYAFQWIDKSCHNECPWNYLRGLLRNNDESSSSSYWRFKSFPIIKEKILLMKNNHDNNDNTLNNDNNKIQQKVSIPLLSLLFEIYESEVNDSSLEHDNRNESLVNLLELYKELCLVDSVKIPYWNNRFRDIPTSIA